MEHEMQGSIRGNRLQRFPGIDFNATGAPLAQRRTLRAVLAVASSRDDQLDKLEVKTSPIWRKFYFSLNRRASWKKGKVGDENSFGACKTNICEETERSPSKNYPRICSVYH